MIGKDNSYLELHCHTNYSFQEGASTISELLNRAKQIGYMGLGLTDHDNLCAAMEFAEHAKIFENFYGTLKKSVDETIIKNDIIFDKEILLGELRKYDWLHLHHEDFTGQYGKFYRNYHNAPWYIDQKTQFENLAKKYGMPSVHEEKKAVSRAIKNYISPING